jgi:hypothetical protein
MVRVFWPTEYKVAAQLVCPANRLPSAILDLQPLELHGRVAPTATSSAPYSGPSRTLRAAMRGLRASLTAPACGAAWSAGRDEGMVSFTIEQRDERRGEMH